MVLICTYGKHLLSALKSSALQQAKHLHELRLRQFNPTLIQQLPFSQAVKPVSFRNRFRLLYLAVAVPRAAQPGCGRASIWLNYRNILSGHSVNDRMLVFTVRRFSTSAQRLATHGSSHGSSNKTGLIYIIAVFIFMLGGAYAAVPLYKVFCQVSCVLMNVCFVYYFSSWSSGDNLTLNLLNNTCGTFTFLLKKIMAMMIYQGMTYRCSLACEHPA